MVPWPLVICRPMPGSLLNFYTNLFETGMSGLVDEKFVLTAELPFRAFVTLNECRNRNPDPQVCLNAIVHGSWVRWVRGVGQPGGRFESRIARPVYADENFFQLARRKSRG